MENPHFQFLLAKIIDVVQVDKFPAYAVELKDKDLSLLYKIKEYFGVGKVQMVKK